MRIIKIIDGFISNSSSSGVIIIIALKKGESFKETLRYYDVPFSESEIHSYFGEVNDNEVDHYIYDHGVEIEHLTDEFDILYAGIEYYKDGGFLN